MTNHFHDIPYLNLARDVLQTGKVKGDRTGTGTISVFGRQMRFDLSSGSIPLLTTKKMSLNAIIHELIWYIAGDSNIRYLVKNNVNIWNEWPFVAWAKDKNVELPEQYSEEWDSMMDDFKHAVRTCDDFAAQYGDLGPVYGKQWRSWKAFDAATIDWSPDKPIVAVRFKQIDQLGKIIETLKNNPDDRRMIVNSWNVGELDEMKLPPCHYTFQFYVADGKLSCMLNQRSCDVGLGVPFNIVQYSILVHMIAQVTGLEPGELIWSGGDVHIYSDHVDHLLPQLEREPYESPTIKLNPDIKYINDFTFDDFEVVGYRHHEAIRMPVAV